MGIAAPREQLGIRCLAQGSHLSHGHFLPEPGFEPTTLGYLGFQVQRSIHKATTAPQFGLTIHYPNLDAGVILNCSKHAVVQPLLKKQGLDDG